MQKIYNKRLILSGMLKKILKKVRSTHSELREKIKSVRRSPRWDDVRDMYIATHESCAACGSMEKIQVHHIKPFHIYPELELEESNLIALCMSENECHLSLGHGGSFRCYNPNIKKDSENFLKSSSEERKLIFESAKSNRKIS